MAIAPIGTDDPFVPTSGPAPEDTHDPAPQVEASVPASTPAPLPEGAGIKIDTTA